MLTTDSLMHRCQTWFCRKILVRCLVSCGTMQYRGGEKQKGKKERKTRKPAFYLLLMLVHVHSTRPL